MDNHHPAALKSSDFRSFRYLKCIFDLDAKIPDRALKLGMAKQKLYR